MKRWHHVSIVSVGAGLLGNVRRR